MAGGTIDESVWSTARWTLDMVGIQLAALTARVEQLENGTAPPPGLPLTADEADLLFVALGYYRRMLTNAEVKPHPEDLEKLEALDCKILKHLTALLKHRFKPKAQETSNGD